MRTVIAIPPMPRMTGGIAVLYQLATRLNECGFSVALAGIPEAPGLAELAGTVEVLPWGKSGEGMKLHAKDRLVVPEGWPNLMAPALTASAKISVYVQNWAYLFSALPEGVLWQKLPVTFLAVSQPVGWFIEHLSGLPVDGIIRPAIDAARFYPSPTPLQRERIRIAWMPRKNRGLAEQIRQIATALLAARDTALRLEWVEIHGMAPDQVAETLRTCHIFLATGFPEGCPLPPLEAMASGCFVVGFAGFGGWDSMRQARSGRYVPRIRLRDVSWGGNGLFAADGDVVEAAQSIVETIGIILDNPQEYLDVLTAAQATAASYSIAAQREDARAVWLRYAV